MGTKQQVCFCADRLAQLIGKPLGQVQRLERQLAAIKGRIGTCRIELQGRKAHIQIFRCPFCRQIGVMIDVGLIAGTGVNIGIGAKALMDLTAEQLIDRLIGLLADNVPAGHLEGAEHPHQG